jgi:hypothetical protein
MILEENIKRDWDNSDKFIQDLAMDFPLIEWGEGSMSISSVPKGWEGIIRDLFESLNKYSKWQRHVLKKNPKYYYNKVGHYIFDKLDRLFNPYRFLKKNDQGWAIIYPHDRERVEKSLSYKIQKALRNFKWNHFRNDFDIVYPPALTIQQIKQKFDLRVYISGGDDMMKGMIAMAEHLASKTCEETGKRGYYCQKRGWYRTLSKAKMKELGFTEVKN